MLNSSAKQESTLFCNTKKKDGSTVLQEPTPLLSSSTPRFDLSLENSKEENKVFREQKEIVHQNQNRNVSLMQALNGREKGGMIQSSNKREFSEIFIPITNDKIPIRKMISNIFVENNGLGSSTNASKRKALLRERKQRAIERWEHLVRTGSIPYNKDSIIPLTVRDSTAAISRIATTASVAIKSKIFKASINLNKVDVDKSISTDYIIRKNKMNDFLKSIYLENINIEYDWESDMFDSDLETFYDEDYIANGFRSLSKRKNMKHNENKDIIKPNEDVSILAIRAEISKFIRDLGMIEPPNSIPDIFLNVLTIKALDSESNFSLDSLKNKIIGSVAEPVHNLESSFKSIIHKVPFPILAQSEENGLIETIRGYIYEERNNIEVESVSPIISITQDTSITENIDSIEDSELNFSTSSGDDDDDEIDINDDDSAFISRLQHYFLSPMYGANKKNKIPYKRPSKIEYDTKDIDKVFSVYWISYDRVLLGTKCDKLISLDIETGVRHVINGISERLANPNEFIYFMTGKCENNNNANNNVNSEKNNYNSYYDSSLNLKRLHYKLRWTDSNPDDKIYNKLNSLNYIIEGTEDNDSYDSWDTLKNDRSRTPIPIGYRYSSKRPTDVAPVYLRSWTGRESPMRISNFVDDDVEINNNDNDLNSNCSDTGENSSSGINTTHPTTDNNNLSTQKSVSYTQNGGIYSIRANKSHTLLAVATGDSKEYVRIYYTKSMTPVAVLKGPTDIVFGIEWISDDVIVSAQRDGRVSMWKIPQCILHNIGIENDEEIVNEYHTKKRRGIRSSINKDEDKSSIESSKILRTFSCIDGTTIYVLKSVSQSNQDSHTLPNSGTRKNIFFNSALSSSSTRVRAIVNHNSNQINASHNSFVSTLGTNGVVCTWDLNRSSTEGMSPIWKGSVPGSMEDSCAMCKIGFDGTDSQAILAIGTLSHICILDTRMPSGNSILKIPVRDATLGTRSIIQCGNYGNVSIGNDKQYVSTGVLAIGSGSGKVSFLDLKAGQYLPYVGDTGDISLSEPYNNEYHNANNIHENDPTYDLMSGDESEYTLPSEIEETYYTSSRSNRYNPGWLYESAQDFQRQFSSLKINMAVFSMGWRPQSNSMNFNAIDSNQMIKRYGPGIKFTGNSSIRTDGSLFVAGGPLQSGFKGSYAALW